MAWLLDGALQLQPFMLATGFARQIIAPTAAGPIFVSAPIIAAHQVAWICPSRRSSC